MNSGQDSHAGGIVRLFLLAGMAIIGTIDDPPAGRRQV